MEKMGISAVQCNLCLELMQQMAYSTSEEKYMDIYSRFKEGAPKEVINYFDSNCTVNDRVCGSHQI